MKTFLLNFAMASTVCSWLHKNIVVEFKPTGSQSTDPLFFLHVLSFQTRVLYLFTSDASLSNYLFPNVRWTCFWDRYIAGERAWIYEPFLWYQMLYKYREKTVHVCEDISSQKPIHRMQLGVTFLSSAVFKYCRREKLSSYR